MVCDELCLHIISISCGFVNMKTQDIVCSECKKIVELLAENAQFYRKNKKIRKTYCFFRKTMIQYAKQNIVVLPSTSVMLH